MNWRQTSAVMVALALGCGSGSSAAETETSRGRLLYETGCIACHTQQAHWRDKRVAADLRSLVGEVRRWAGLTGLGWNEEEIQHVVLYLDQAFYRFPAR